jgi:ubiquinone/menaquinone biosynthesis C-methylase UbiE
VAKSMSGRQANPPARPVGDGYMAREGHRSLAGRHEHEFDSLPGRIAGWAMSFGRSRSTRLLVDLAGVGPGDRVVDVGCGPGLFLKAAAERGATAVGVDPSVRMRRLALRRIPAGLRPAVTVVDGAAERQPLSDPDAGLDEVRRVLAPGGRLLIAERLADQRGWFRGHALTWEAAEGLAAKVRRAGFAEVAVARHQAGRRQLVVVAGRHPADAA